MGRPRVLRRERILRSTIDLVRREGFAALSLRRLGEELGVGATSLYGHVDSKGQLLDLVIDELVGRMHVPEAGSARQRLVGFGESARAVLNDYPGMAEVILQRGAAGPHAAALAEAVLSALAELGVPPGRLMDAYHSLLVYVNGFAISSLTARHSDSPERVRRLQTELADIDPATRPVLASVVRLPSSGDRVRFRYGLDALITGLATTDR